MVNNPTIIIQIQRMGDLIISFSLIKKLLRAESSRPIWVVAEPCFYEPLCSLAPSVVFFSLEMSPQLKTARYQRVINISHREESAQLAGALKAEEYIGLVQDKTSLFISGDWRLYRASIVGNNRYNLFHWSDLEALGVVPEKILKEEAPPLSKSIGVSGNVGIFVGASEEMKRPDANFWGLLASFLVKQGLSPFFLGGPGDIALAEEATRIARLDKTCNFAGRFSLLELAAFFQTLDVLITPDTGPMHLANWVQTSIIDLSMGNVNPWETAALSSGHTVITSSMSCVGCWHCDGRDFVCRQAFTPDKIGGIVLSILKGSALGKADCDGLTIYRTSRDDRGLFSLNSLLEEQINQRVILGSFWKEWFISVFGGTTSRLPIALEALYHNFPEVVLTIKRDFLQINKFLLSIIKGNTLQLPQNFWESVTPAVRPFTGYLDLLLQNSEDKRQTLNKALQMACSLEEKLK